MMGDARRAGRGLTPRQETLFDWLVGWILVALVGAWTVSVMEAYGQQGGPEPTSLPPRPMPVRAVGAQLLDPRARSAAYLTEAQLAFLSTLRGESGKVKVALRSPGDAISTLRPEPELAAHFEDESGRSARSDDFTAPQDPGVYRLAVELGKVRQAVDDLRVVSLVPFTEKKGGRIGLYYLGNWPYERGGRPRTATYAPPRGFIMVTRENRSTPVSEHFRLGDFLTKDQRDVWPKYLLLDPRLLDKLELTIEELRAQGHDVRGVHVMSGFRTPRYNESGGDTGGRAGLSRHMYGDGADVYVDNNRDGQPDDLTRDGRVDVRDAEAFARAVERVEAEHPALLGGVGIYRACCGHGPFTHVDVRGYRARWRGSGSG